MVDKVRCLSLFFHASWCFGLGFGVSKQHTKDEIWTKISQDYSNDRSPLVGNRDLIFVIVCCSNCLLRKILWLHPLADISIILAKLFTSYSP